MYMYVWTMHILCMYVCMYMYIIMYVCTCTYIRMCVYVHVRSMCNNANWACWLQCWYKKNETTQRQMYVCMYCMYVYTCMCVYMYSNYCMYVCIYVLMYVCIYTYSNMYVHVAHIMCIYMYVLYVHVCRYAYVRMCSSLNVCITNCCSLSLSPSSLSSCHSPCLVCSADRVSAQRQQLEALEKVISLSLLV